MLSRLLLLLACSLRPTLSSLRLRLIEPLEKLLLRRPWSRRVMRDTLLGLTECPGPSNMLSPSSPYRESRLERFASAIACWMSSGDAPSV